MQESNIEDLSIINIPLYGYDIILKVGNTYETLVFLVEWFDEDDKDMEYQGKLYGPYDGMVAAEFDEYVLVISLDKEKLTPGLVAHEAFHASKLILNHCGIIDEEALAYLLDYIVNQIHLYLNDNNNGEGTDK